MVTYQLRNQNNNSLKSDNTYIPIYEYMTTQAMQNGKEVWGGQCGIEERGIRD